MIFIDLANSSIGAATIRSLLSITLVRRTTISYREDRLEYNRYKYQRNYFKIIL